MPEAELAVPLSVPDEEAAKLAADLAMNKKLAAENATLRKRLKASLALADRFAELLETANANR